MSVSAGVPLGGLLRGLACLPGETRCYPSGWRGILFVVRRLRHREITLGGLPIGSRWDVLKSERDILHPLFVALGDEPALQAEAVDPPTVRAAVESIRVRVTSTLVELGPDAAAAPSLEFLRRACHEYLDIASDLEDWQKVARLRATFCMVAEFIGREYRLRSATRLAGTIELPDLA